MQLDASADQTTLLTTKQLLARLPVCKRTLDNWKARGLVPYIKVGKCCLYDWDRVQAALRTHERGPVCTGATVGRGEGQPVAPQPGEGGGEVTAIRCPGGKR